MLRYRSLWLGLGWLFVALVVYLSLTPDPIPAAEAYGFDAGHALAYAWLMFWFGQIERASRTRLRIALALCALGISLELMQGLTTYREFSWADMRDNIFGVVLGVILAATPLVSILSRFDARLALQLDRARRR